MTSHAGVPQVGLALGAGMDDGVRLLCSELGRRVAVVDVADLQDPRTGVLMTPLDPARTGDRPVVMWVADDGAVRRGAADAARLVLSPSAATAAAAGERGLPAHVAPVVDLGADAAPMPGFVRDRVRRARGLPPAVIAVQQGGTWQQLVDGKAAPVAGRLVPTLLGLVTAAVVTAPGDLVVALAWGCPTVTTPEAAASVGASDGCEVVVTDTAGALEAAQALAGDVRAMARLARAGRALYEERHSVRHTADAVLAALHVHERWMPSNLATRMAELDSRRHAGATRRTDELVAGITSHTAGRT